MCTNFLSTCSTFTSQSRLVRWRILSDHSQEMSWPLKVVMVGNRKFSGKVSGTCRKVIGATNMELWIIL